MGNEALAPIAACQARRPRQLGWVAFPVGLVFHINSPVDFSEGFIPTQPPAKGVPAEQQFQAAR
jgi:hypothetical protein